MRKTVPLIQALKESGLTAKDIDAVAYTAGPGLVGALLVGATVGRSLAFAWDVPASADHMEGHLLAPMLEDNPAVFSVCCAACFRRSYAVNQRDWHWSVRAARRVYR
ncbi:hypothetical protein ACLB1N_29310 [Escherichia coli]